MKVLNFICSHTEYEGYIQPRIAKREGGFMHAEMAVCSRSGIHKIIQPIGQVAVPPPKGRTYQSMKDELRMRLMGQQMEASRKAAASRRREPTSPVSPAAAVRLRF
jgi:hypothetical protein